MHKGKLLSPSRGLFLAGTSFSLLLDTIDTLGSGLFFVGSDDEDDDIFEPESSFCCF